MKNSEFKTGLMIIAFGFLLFLGTVMMYRILSMPITPTEVNCKPYADTLSLDDTCNNW